MTRRLKLTLADGDRATIFVHLPEGGEHVAATSSGMRPKPRPRAREMARPRLRFFDLGTHLGGFTRYDGTRLDEFYETTLWGPAVPAYQDLDRNRRALLANFTSARLDRSGRTVENCWPFQVDEETANASVTLIFDGAYGERTVALATGAPRWVAPASSASQAASIAALAARTVEVGAATLGLDGLARWSARLAAEAVETWGPYTAGRIGREGTAVPHLAPGEYLLTFACPYNYEPWRLGDRALYKVTSHDAFEAPEVDPPLVRVADATATRLDVFAAPQLHDVTFQWIAMYEVSVGWWSTIIFLPTTRRMTLRASFRPHMFEPSGTAKQGVSIGTAMSDRIRDTPTYAEAIVSDTRGGPFFRLVGRIQGRYAIRVRDYDEGALCAILRYRYLDETTKVYYVWRRTKISRNLAASQYKIEVDGLATQEVAPWIPDLVINGEEAGDINVGI